MASDEPRTEVVAPDVVDRALKTYLAAGGKDDPRMRAALKAALVDKTFRIGDEVMGEDGGLVGVIIEIHGEEAVISWARGKSREPVSTLEHVPEEP